MEPPGRGCQQGRNTVVAAAGQAVGRWDQGSEDSGQGSWTGRWVAGPQQCHGPTMPETEGSPVKGMTPEETSRGPGWPLLSAL